MFSECREGFGRSFLSFLGSEVPRCIFVRLASKATTTVTQASALPLGSKQERKPFSIDTYPILTGFSHLSLLRGAREKKTLMGTATFPFTSTDNLEQGVSTSLKYFQ